LMSANEDCPKKTDDVIIYDDDARRFVVIRE
jgi:hypothetical protein